MTSQLLQVPPSLYSHQKPGNKMSMQSTKLKCLHLKFGGHGSIQIERGFFLFPQTLMHSGFVFSILIAHQGKCDRAQNLKKEQELWNCWLKTGMSKADNQRWEVMHIPKELQQLGSLSCLQGLQPGDSV